MNIKQLEYFVAVSGFKSINRAAEHLYVSQQALSSAILSLEKELGFDLFQRSPSSITLTERGNRILEDARQVVAIVSRWQLVADNPELAVQGKVHIAAPTDLCSRIMVDIISECQQKYPMLTVSLREVHGNEAVGYALNGKASIVLGIYTNTYNEERLAQLAQSTGLYFEELERDEFEVFLNAAHPLAGCAKLTPEQLGQLTLVCYPEDLTHFPYPVLLKQFSQERRFAFARREDILNFVSKNVNVAAVFPKNSSRCPSDERRGNIVLRAVEGMDLGMTCYLLCPPKNSRTHSEQILIDMIRDHIARDAC